MCTWLIGGEDDTALMLLDRRSVPRYSWGPESLAPLSAFVDFPAWPARIGDLSTDGISLVLGIWHPPGKIMRLKLINQNRTVSHFLQVRVAHAQLEPDDQWRIGCLFKRPLGAEELEALLGANWEQSACVGVG